MGRWQAGRIVALELGYVLILALLMIGRQAHVSGLSALPNPIGGIIPLAVPWFGALGAVTISIYGAVAHYDDWQTKFNAWHVVRPAIGAITGTMAYLILIGVIQATGTTPSMTAAAKNTTSAASITYLVVAFVVGYREDTFRTLVKRVVDVLLSPGDVKTAPTVSVEPSPIGFAENRSTRVATVTNSGTGKLVISNATANPPGVSVEGEGFTITNNAVAGATVNPGAAARLTISFDANSPGQKEGVLIIHSNAGTFKVNLTGTAT